MKTLSEYIIESMMITEGGMSGHMAHPIDYVDFTAGDLKELISALFSGEIEDVTEKIDGTNIQASMNDDGEVIFIRNKGDLNSERGGMSINDMAVKWADKPSVAQTYITAGETITKVFNKLGSKWFNPSPDVRRIVNCECVIAGVTNIMPYAEAQVDFHDIWIYTDEGFGWTMKEVTKKGLSELERACQDIDSAKITPKVIIDVTNKSNELINKYHSMIDKTFDDDNLTIDQWKYNRFVDIVNGSHDWIASDADGMKILYNRWFNAMKTPSMRVIKDMYKDHLNELVDMDNKGFKKVVGDVVEPLDDIFLKLGNDIIRLCQGLVNGSKNDKVITRLQDDMKNAVRDVKASGSAEAQEKLLKQLGRIERLGGSTEINSTEGIVFRYKDRLMKLTGTFAPLNAILGNIKYSK